MPHLDPASTISRLLAPVTEGRIAPGSGKGRALLEEALRIDPDRTAELIRPIDPVALREGMRTALIPESRIMELLRSPRLDGGSAPDPFSSGPIPSDPTPFPDPTLELDRGPRPPWAQ